MKCKTLDYSFVQKVIYRKVRKNIAWAEYDQQWLPFNKKIDFALNRLKQIHFSRLKVILLFWEKYEVVQKTFKRNHICNYLLIRDYKMGRRTPGMIEIHFDECFDEKLIRTLIKKHYGYELAKEDSLCIDLIFVFETDGAVTIYHLYDDRGFQVFYLDQNYVFPSTITYKKP